MAETIKITRCDHELVDTGEHFVINTLTRNISHPNSNVLSLVQGDANSEVYTIQLPGAIDTHPMNRCNRVEIHYINTGSAGEVCEDIYEVEELKSYPNDDENLYAEWVLSANASMYSGTLAFAIKFMCVADDEEGTVLYSWSTLPFTGITVGRTITNSESVYEQYSDILAQWYEKLTRASNSLDIRIEDEVRAAEQAIVEKGKVVAGSLSERYKEYGAESYTYFLNLIYYSCGMGAGSFIIVRGVPISITNAGELKYIRIVKTTDSINTLEVYVGDDNYPEANNSFISGYASCEWYGDESIPDQIDIKFSVQLDTLIDNVNSQLTIQSGHTCLYDPEPYIQGYSTETLNYRDVSSWESYVKDRLENFTSGSMVYDYIDNYFSIEKLKSVKPMIDQAIDRVKQYTDYQLRNLDISNVKMIDRETGEAYSIFIENGQLKLEPYIEPYKE